MKSPRISAIILATLFTVTSCALLPSLRRPGEPAAGRADTEAGESDGPAKGAPHSPAEEDRPAPEDESEPAAETIRPRPVARGQQSAVRIPVAITISDQTTMDEVWAAIHANTLSAPIVPEIDFSSELVILLILGERPTAGYGVRATHATVDERSVAVFVEVTTPDPGSMNATVLTSPFELSAIPAFDLPVTFAGDDVREGFDEE